jgi:hypothetical protein
VGVTLLARFALSYRILACLLAAAVGGGLLPASAGTTGSIRGRVTDAKSGAPVAGASVTVVSPSQTATTKTDGAGGFAFISLVPDTYVVRIEAQGHDPLSVPGITVAADQVQNFAFQVQRALTTIARVSSQSAGSLVRAGTSSNVYSVNASTQRAANAIAGAGSLNTAYSAIASAPGVSVPQGQQGWNQGVYVRGGDVADVAVEVDGIPISRPSDFGTATSLSSLGQQQVQVYTGGTPASDSAALAGFINQVVKTGTFPNEGTLDLSAGSPPFYHRLAVEAGGATQDRLFSYYVGTEGANQAYRFGDQFNGVSNPLAFWPISVPSANGFNYDGSGPFVYARGAANAPSFNQSRQTVVNLHFGIAHHHDAGRDDVQMFYETGEIFGNAYNTQPDLGFPSIPLGLGTHNPYVDAVSYTGALYQPGNSSELTPYFQPSSPTAREPGAAIPYDVGDNTDNGWSIAKLQYQRNINERSYVRAYAYTQFTNWFINGPVSASMLYGAFPQDYEASSHVWGGKISYENQLGTKNLVSATASVDAQRIVTMNATNFNPADLSGLVFNYTDKSGQCHDPASGAFVSCFAGSTGYASTFVPVQNSIATIAPAFPSTAPAACGTSTCRWLITENGRYGSLDTVEPTSYAYSLGDHIQPSDKWTVDLGLRWERYSYAIPNTAGSPARAFWFAAWNRENCFYPGTTAPTALLIDPATGASLIQNPNGTTSPAPPCPSSGQLFNTTPGNVNYYAFEPRVAATYTVNPDTVLRASVGRYAQAPSSTSQEFNYIQQDLPSQLAQFLPYGFNTPYHEQRPEYSSSYDLSLERRIHGTNYSYSVTPYYRQTYDQVQLTPVGPQGIFSAFNTDSQTNYGLEFLFRKGDFAAEGLSYQLTYTLNESKVRYNDLGSTGQNAVDVLNNYVQLYNSYTGNCGTGTGPGSPCGAYGTAFSAPTFPAADGSTVANPYYGKKAQPLFDRNGRYTPYDVLPSPFSGATGYNVPTTIALIVNYKRDRWTFTPTATFVAGGKYGSPLTWPGYDPATCATAPAPNTATGVPCGMLLIPDVYTGKFDAQGAFVAPSRLTANMQIAYQIDNRVNVTLSMLSLIDQCYQRGYVWDNAMNCQYGQLPSNHLAPVGNFVPLATAPIQLRYPYGVYGNPTNNGFVATRMPFSAFVNVNVKL